MVDSGSSESWNRLVIAAKNQWITNIKSEQIEEAESAESTTGFCLDYDSCSEGDAEASAFDPLQTSLNRSESNFGAPGTKQEKEAPKHRAERLAKMSAYAAQRLANETPEQRAARLKRMSEYAAKRLANETSEQRTKRLTRMSAYAARRLAQETPEQRQERLTRMSAYAAKRHAMKKMICPHGKRIRKSKNPEKIPTDKVLINNASE